MSPDTRTPWRTAGQHDVGIYGFAKSYQVESGERLDRPPYFFRGSLAGIAVGDTTTVQVSPQAVALSEEIELVVVLDRADGDGAWQIVGYSFGNDLTDLGEFRQDPARILWAKSPTASICAGYWTAPLPEHVAAKVVMSRDGEEVAAYETVLGTSTLRFDAHDLPDLVASFAGVDQFQQLCIFTGAPRGFAWGADDAEPLGAGHSVTATISDAITTTCHLDLKRSRGSR